MPYGLQLYQNSHIQHVWSCMHSFSKHKFQCVSNGTPMISCIHKKANSFYCTWITRGNKYIFIPQKCKKVVYIIQCVILGFYKTVANYDFSLCQTLMYKFKKFPTNNQSSNNQFIYTGAIQIFHGLVCESNHKC